MEEIALLLKKEMINHMLNQVAQYPILLPGAYAPPWPEKMATRWHNLIVQSVRLFSPFGTWPLSKRYCSSHVNALNPLTSVIAMNC